MTEKIVAGEPSLAFTQKDEPQLAYRYFIVRKKSLTGTTLVEHSVVAHILQPSAEGMIVFYDVSSKASEPILNLRRVFYHVEDVEEINLPSKSLLAH